MSKDRIARKPPLLKQDFPLLPTRRLASPFDVAVRCFGPDIIGQLCGVAEAYGVTRDPMGAEGVRRLRGAVRSHACGTRADRKP